MTPEVLRIKRADIKNSLIFRLFFYVSWNLP